MKVRLCGFLKVCGCKCLEIVRTNLIICEITIAEILKSWYDKVY